MTANIRHRLHFCNHFWPQTLTKNLCKTPFPPVLWECYGLYVMSLATPKVTKKKKAAASKMRAKKQVATTASLLERERMRVDALDEAVKKLTASLLNSQPPAFMRVAELAKLHGVSPALIYKWIRLGKLPTKRIGRSLLIPVDAARLAFDGVGGDDTHTGE